MDAQGMRESLLTYAQEVLEQLAKDVETLASDQRSSIRWQNSKRAKADCQLRGETYDDAAGYIRERGEVLAKLLAEQKGR